MNDYRIPKRIFYSQLAHGTRTCGGQYKRYKDTLKANMKTCGIPSAELESRVVDRDAWRTSCREAIEKLESTRIDELKEKAKATHVASYSPSLR